MNQREIEELCLRYLDENLTEQEARVLDRLIAKSDAAARTLARLAIHDQHFEVATSLRSAEIEQESNTEQALDELLRLEHQGHMNFATWREQQANKAAAERRKALLTRSLISGAVAAALLVAVSLLTTFFTSDTPEVPVAGQQTNEQDTTNPVTPTHAVATLTASYNATWATPGGTTAPTVYDALHPGDRLTLTGGFAEITTNRGVIAILEAPATIELLNNDNAIRLHTGKLVGICETELSKGFLVRTPHLDITDLGTRFGIQADANATEVHVIEGKVQAERVDAPFGTEPTLLVANQSARTSAGSDAITRIDHDADRFAAMLPTTIQLPGTGLGLSVGQADPSWVLISENGETLPTPIALRVSDAEGHIRDLANAPRHSQWLATRPKKAPDRAFTTHRIRTTIEVPSGLDPSTAKLDIQYAADNQLAGILINGTRVEMPPQALQLGWVALTPISIDHPLIAGTNTIEFDIINRRPPKGWDGYELGIRLAWQLHASPLLLAEERTEN